MDRSNLLRRSAHALIALAPIYYLLPTEFPVVPVHRWQFLILLFAIVAVFEAFRLRKGMTFKGLRPHEGYTIASFAWAAAGITIALWLMPMEIATPVLIGMGLCDPLVGELRRMNAKKTTQILFPMVVYFAICCVSLSLMTDVVTITVVALSFVGAWLAVMAERTRIPMVDDDFLMIIVPGIAMSLLWLSL